MYMPTPSYGASWDAPSPSQLDQRNQTVDRFNRTQDTYVIAIGVQLCHAPVVAHMNCIGRLNTSNASDRGAHTHH